jgi:purine-binding chemotaxis protein CheW
MEPGSAIETDAGPMAAPAAQWLVVACDGHAFAVPLERVRAIQPAPAFTRVPGCGAAVCGLAGVRGRIVTAFDLGVLLGLAPSRRASDARLLLMEHGQRTLGLVVDEVRFAAALQLETQAAAGPDAAVAPDAADVLGTGSVAGVAVTGLNTATLFERLLG